MCLSKRDKTMLVAMFRLENVPVAEEIQEWIDEEPFNPAEMVLYDFVEMFLRRKAHKGEHRYEDADEALNACYDEIWELINEQEVNIYG